MGALLRAARYLVFEFVNAGHKSIGVLMHKLIATQLR